MRRYLNRLVRFLISKVEGTGLEQELDRQADTGTLAEKNIIPLARQAAAEGIVLLKNENATLPLKPSDQVAIFGRVAIDYFAVGYGSGGDVRRPYAINLVNGLINNGVKINNSLHNVYQNWVAEPKNRPDEGYWGNWPLSFPEMALSDQLVQEAAEESDLALIVIGRAAGEARENLLQQGSYYLTDLELDMLAKVTKYFQRVAVILNCGNIIDLSWLEDFQNKIGAVLYAWQGGMESGNALAHVLTGKINPCGKLTTTIPTSYNSLPSAANFGGKKFNNYIEDIYVGYRYFETFAPEKVLFPFGFGLSYTEFNLQFACENNAGNIKVICKIANSGKLPGKEVIQVYLEAPQGVLGKPVKTLASFKKTKELKPGETETFTLEFNLASFASYDDTGVTGNKSAYVLEAGDYQIYAGTDIRNTQLIATITLTELEVVKQLQEVMPLQKVHSFTRMTNRNGKVSFEPLPISAGNLKQKILKELPTEMQPRSQLKITFGDVKKGRYSLEEFIAQLTPEELEALSRGEGKMNSSLGVPGNAGAFGGVTESLRQRGIPPVITADGPSGIRIWRTCALLPCGTALASSFNTELVADLYSAIGREMKFHGVDLLLAPGLNIHRNPLCGRNFEYFSEDPLLSGRMGAAVVKGVQKEGVSACPKHFACNNQETHRNINDSRVSERALREIYLKGFEIVIKESNPHATMTSYNKINGVWAHYNYDLATTVLRSEWGYEGLVITDWWMRRGRSPEFPNLTNDAYRVRAQVDVLMPGGDGHSFSTRVGRHLLRTLGEPDGITLAEMQRTAENVLNFILKSSAADRIE